MIALRSRDLLRRLERTYSDGMMMQQWDSRPSSSHALFVPPGCREIHTSLIFLKAFFSQLLMSSSCSANIRFCSDISTRRVPIADRGRMDVTMTQWLTFWLSCSQSCVLRESISIMRIFSLTNGPLIYLHSAKPMILHKRHLAFVLKMSSKCSARGLGKPLGH